MKEEPIKFLGANITFKNNAEDQYELLKEKLEEKFNNVDDTKIRGEYKIKIYSKYILPSMRFNLSVQNIRKGHMEKLDDISRMYIKKWLQYPKNGVTDVVLYHHLLFDLKKTITNIPRRSY